MLKQRRRVEHDLLGKKRVSKGINSKDKGNRGEWAAAKWLTQWTGHKFARTPGSGGLRWVDNDLVCGDLVCEEKNYYFPFTIEVKNYKSFGLTSYLRKNSIIYKWWEQAKEDAERAEKIPLLLIRKNGMPKGEFYLVMYLRMGNYVDGVDLPGAWGDDIMIFKGTDILEFSNFTNFIKKLQEHGHIEKR